MSTAQTDKWRPPPLPGGDNSPGIPRKNVAEAGVRIIPYPKPELPPEKFPSEALPPFLRKIAEDLARVYQTPVCLPAMSALAVLSGAVGRSITVRGAFRDKDTPLNLYVIAVAERGSGKGIVGKILSAPLIQRSDELAMQHRQDVARKRGELGVLRREIQELEGKAARTPDSERAQLVKTLEDRHARLAQLETDAAKQNTLWLGDTTSEAMARALADNGETLFSYSSEGGALIKVALGKYTEQGDFDILLSGYSGDSVRVDRISRAPLQLKNPCLSLLWLVQPLVIRELVGDVEAFSRGLTARPLIFDTGARREHDDRSDIEFTKTEEWAAFVGKFLDFRFSNKSPYAILCTKDAREVFTKFHDESVDLERDQYVDLVGELSRWRENAIKVAGLLTIADDATEVSKEVAERAVAIVRWCGLNYLGLLQAGRRGRLRDDFERVLGLLRKNGGAINMGTLERSHGFTRAQIEALAAAFPADLMIERLPQPGAGRPAEVLRVVTKST